MFISSVQDAFLTTVSKKKETVNRTSSKRKRGWFTIEGMKTGPSSLPESYSCPDYDISKWSVLLKSIGSEVWGLSSKWIALLN